MFDISLLDVPLGAPALGNPSGSPSPSPSPDLICVCCNCDRIRSRSGKWCDPHTPQAGERRTHGLCPECFAVLYPEYAGLAGR
jgi:hypothetical protein